VQVITKNISISASGDNTVIPAQPGAPIRVWALVISNAVATAQTVVVKDGVAGTALATLILPSSIAGNITASVDEISSGAIYQLSPGNAFVLNLSAATQVSGFVNYTVGN
jgi:hypothetical protein